MKSMICEKSERKMMAQEHNKTKQEECFYGTATVGERGQIVIPAEARKALDIQPGEKLLIWQHPSAHGLMLFKVDSVREFMQAMQATLERAERQDEKPDENERQDEKTSETERQDGKPDETEQQPSAE